MSTKFCLTLLFVSASLSAQVAIVNNAGFRSDQPVSAGSWAAAFGTFAGVTTTTAPSLPLPKILGGVKVTIDGTDAAIYDVRSTQVTFLIPYSTTPGLKAVQISTAGGTLTGAIRIIPAAPGLFTTDTATPPRGAIRNQDGVTANSSTSPTRRGDVISIYGTGPGSLTRQPQDGAAPGATPLAKTVSTPQVFIGGVEAVVEFSGLNPDAPGLWQINVRVPNMSFLTGRVPVQVFMDGVDSNEVTVFVQ